MPFSGGEVREAHARKACYQEASGSYEILFNGIHIPHFYAGSICLILACLCQTKGYIQNYNPLSEKEAA